MANTRMIILACALGSAVAAAQEPGFPDPGPNQPPTAQAADAEPSISLKDLAIKTLHDQKPIFTFPFKAVRGEHWQAVLGVAAGTAALIALDPYTEPYFHDGTRFSSYKTGPLRGRNTTLAVTLTPVAFYVAGLAKHSSHAKNTGLLAAEALIDTQLLSFLSKQAIGRLTPGDIPPNGNLRDTWFKYKGTFTNGGSFPRATPPPHSRWQP